MGERVQPIRKMFTVTAELKEEKTQKIDIVASRSIGRAYNKEYSQQENGRRVANQKKSTISAELKGSIKDTEHANNK